MDIAGQITGLVLGASHQFIDRAIHLILIHRPTSVDSAFAGSIQVLAGSPRASLRFEPAL
jgi:hypothetical protein